MITGLNIDEETERRILRHTSAWPIESANAFKSKGITGLIRDYEIIIASLEKTKDCGCPDPKALDYSNETHSYDEYFYYIGCRRGIDFILKELTSLEKKRIEEIIKPLDIRLKKLIEKKDPESLTKQEWWDGRPCGVFS